MEAVGQEQEAHRLVMAVGFGKDLRDHPGPHNQESTICLSQKPLPQLLES